MNQFNLEGVRMGAKCISQTGNSVLSHRPFHGFFQFLTWTSLGKSVDTTQRSALKLVKLPSLNMICWKLMKIHLLKVVNFYKPLYGGGQVCASHHTNVCKILRLCSALSSLAKDVSLSNLAITSFKVLFPDRFSLTGPYKKLKKPWRFFIEIIWPPLNAPE